MAELENSEIKELLRRTKLTTKSRYIASERLSSHQKVSQWTVAFISAALVFIPILQAYGVDIRISEKLLNSFQAILAVMVLVYSLLLGQENFVSRAESMHRSGVELGKFARKLRGFPEDYDKYDELVEEYYSILEKYENHKPIDYLFTRLLYKPDRLNGWPAYLWLYIRAQFFMWLGYTHYIVAISFVIYVFYYLLSNIK
ncbi:SLATT domain-containing protein [Aeromonas jandaei]|uniref:SLATT domain-containing protein n=1 Tax=Aeromonas jandaei TaxID=650 RepID=UPI001C5A6028|nr:SLATT domain-containing protein [Aeromonas jandaei]MBW3761972.1 SLATT domain-containing protein [Aeromonas jandaei]